MQSRAVKFSLFAFVAFSSAVVFSQNLLQVTDRRAASLASQSMAALTRGAAIADVRLTANVTWMAGAQAEAGTGVFFAKGTEKSRVELTLNSGGQRIEIRNSERNPTGRWTNPDRKSGKYSSHNCWTDPVWFFPALSFLGNVADPRFGFSNLGRGTWNGTVVRHLRTFQVFEELKQPAVAREKAQKLSEVDYYLDPSSLLPLGAAFRSHPDNDMNADIFIEIRFEEYKLINGVEVPTHVQRLQNGAVIFDVVVTGASFNNVPPDGLFDPR